MRVHKVVLDCLGFWGSQADKVSEALEEKVETEARQVLPVRRDTKAHWEGRDRLTKSQAHPDHQELQPGRIGFPGRPGTRGLIGDLGERGLKGGSGNDGETGPDGTPGGEAGCDHCPPPRTEDGY
uniref:Collagen triple helix repeat protein n=1 Tax=Globodera pallida TaxID=36090 RepID=A0A183BRM8_GLOPA